MTNKTIYAVEDNNVFLHISESPDGERQLSIKLIGKPDDIEEILADVAGKRDDIIIAEILEHTMSNSSWEFVQAEELGFLVDDLLPILSEDTVRDDRGQLLAVAWVYALRDTIWVYNGVEDELRTKGFLTFDGVKTELIHIPHFSEWTPIGRELFDSIYEGGTFGKFELHSRDNNYASFYPLNFKGMSAAARDMVKFPDRQLKVVSFNDGVVESYEVPLVTQVALMQGRWSEEA